MCSGLQLICGHWTLSWHSHFSFWVEGERANPEWNEVVHKLLVVTVYIILSNDSVTVTGIIMLTLVWSCHEKKVCVCYTCMCRLKVCTTNFYNHEMNCCIWLWHHLPNMCMFHSHFWMIPLSLHILLYKQALQGKHTIITWLPRTIPLLEGKKLMAQIYCMWAVFTSNSKTQNIAA